MSARVHLKKKGKSASKNNQLFALVDRAKTLSDGSAVSLQDRFDMKGANNNAPVNIPRNFTRKELWIRSSYTGGFSSANTPVYGALNFQLTFVNNVTSYQSIFDQYCIVAAIVRFQPECNNSQGSQLGSLITVIDHDDSNALSSVGAALEYSTALETPLYEQQTVVLRPRFAVGSYSGAFTGFANQSGYIDCASSTVQHYGVKYVTTAAANTQPVVYYVELIIHFRDYH
jgi:hypothetical protein